MGKEKAIEIWKIFWREGFQGTQENIKRTGYACVNCGENATKGSMKHPYCEKCFKKIWNNDYDKYGDWLSKTHPEPFKRK